MGRVTRIEEPARGAELAHEGKPLGFADVSERTNRLSLSTTEHAGNTPRPLTIARGLCPSGRVTTVEVQHLIKPKFDSLAQHPGHAEVVVKIKEFARRSSWQNPCVVRSRDERLSNHLFHFGASGVQRIASDSAGRSYLPRQG